MKSAKEIFVFRHAEKDYSAEADPPLSIRGLKQAEKLAKAVEEGQIPRPQKLWSSPKRRALQSFLPLSELLGLEITVDPMLDQRIYSESGRDFGQRVRSFIDQKLTLQNEFPLFICTHSDWIENLGWAAPLKGNLNIGQLILTSGHYLKFELDDKGLWRYLSRGGFD